MNEQTTKLIESLAAKLGTTAEYLWSVLVNQAYVSGIKSLIGIIISLLVSFALYKVYKFAAKKIDVEGEDDNEGFWAIRILTGVAQIIPFILVLYYTSNAFNAFMNPEYWALKELLDTL
jgi:O-antigen/teichoic acid export membrane protein